MEACTSLSSYPELLEMLLYWGDRNNLISSDYQKYKWIAWVKMPQGLPCGLVSEERKKRHLARAFAAFLAWTSLLMRMVSRLTGLGTKPTMPSSFTGRPIHQSLLNFCMWKKKERDLSAAFQQPSRHATVRWTSLTWRKSRASKVMAWPGTGTLSSSAGV